MVGGGVSKRKGIIPIPYEAIREWLYLPDSVSIDTITDYASTECILVKVSGDCLKEIPSCGEIPHIHVSDLEDCL